MKLKNKKEEEEEASKHKWNVLCVEKQAEMTLSAQTHVERGQSGLIDKFRICLSFGFNQIVHGFLPWFIKKKKKKTNPLLNYIFFLYPSRLQNF